MTIFGVKLKILDYIIFFFYFAFWGLYFLINLDDGAPLFYLLVEAWFVFFPYFMAYKYKYIHNKTSVFVNFIVTFIVNTIIMFILLPKGFSEENCGSLGFFTYIYLFLAFCCFFAENKNSTEKNLVYQNKQIKNNVKIQSNTSNISNIDISNIDICNLNFDDLKKLSRIDFEQSISKCFINAGIPCKIANIQGIDIIANNQYAVGFNLSDYALTVNVLERLLLNLNGNNLKVIIISKYPYGEDIVNWCIENKLNVELLIEEDFKNITNYFYTPKYEKLGISFFEYIQKCVLEYI